MHGCIIPCHDFKKSKGPALICRNTFIYMENLHQKKNTKFTKKYEPKKGTGTRYHREYSLNKCAKAIIYQVEYNETSENKPLIS
jgi:hypothetical protein